jgi:hypothetical protein
VSNIFCALVHLTFTKIDVLGIVIIVSILQMWKGKQARASYRSRSHSRKRDLSRTEAHTALSSCSSPPAILPSALGQLGSEMEYIGGSALLPACADSQRTQVKRAGAVGLTGAKGWGSECQKDLHRNGLAGGSIRVPCLPCLFSPKCSAHQEPHGAPAQGCGWLVCRRKEIVVLHGSPRPLHLALLERKKLQNNLYDGCDIETSSDQT